MYSPNHSLLQFIRMTLDIIDSSQKILPWGKVEIRGKNKNKGENESGEF